MTENKRFYIEDEHIKDRLEAYNSFYVETYKEAKRFCNFLNDLNQEVIDAEHYHNVVLENFKAVSKENEQLKRANDIAIDSLVLCQEKNSELELRNNRQAKTIHNLYSLMENKDWEGLTAIVEEMEEAEELNRLEFKAYCGDKDE